MWACWGIAVLFLTVGSVGDGWAEDAIGTRPLLTIARKDLHTILPPNCQILIDPHSIERFLDALDGNPPDWGLVYGLGHYDPLIPDESVEYDFSHDQEGLGVIMPVVKVKRLDYLLTNK